MAKAKSKTKVKVKVKVKAKEKAKEKMKVKAKSKPVVPPKANMAKTKNVNLSQFISPLDDRVLVQVQKGERMTPGGLFIPDTAQISGNQRGVVVAVGRGHRDNKGRIRPLELKIGDLILLPEHLGNDIQVSGQQVKILRESEILGVITQ